MLSRLGAVVALGLLVSACSSTATPPGGSTGSTSGSSGTTGASFETAHARCLQIGSAACQHDVTCGYVDAADVSLCEATWNCDSIYVEKVNDEQVDAGLATVDATSLQSCLSAIAQGSCDETGGAIERATALCDEISRGQAADGASCKTGNDCAPGHTCLRDTTACGGVCTAWITSGPCGPGNPAVAAGYLCADDGGAVAQVGQGVQCNNDRECLAGFVCQGLAGARTCQTLPYPPLDAGSSCTGANTCGPSLTCFGARTSQIGTCMRQGPVGASCAWIFPDGGLDAFVDGGPRPQSGLCGPEAYCDPATITCLGESTVGAPCATDGGDPSCLEGACIAEPDGTGQCAYAVDLQPCAASADCQSGYCIGVGDGGDVCASTCP